MKKLFTLIALLGMCVSGAWADTQNVFRQDFSNSLTYTTGWTNGNTSRIGFGQMTRSDIDGADKTAFISYKIKSDNGATATYSALRTLDVSSLTNYTLDFDFALSNTTNQAPSFILKDRSGNAIVTLTGVTKNTTKGAISANITDVTSTPQSVSFYVCDSPYNIYTLEENAATLTIFNHVHVTADPENGTSITVSFVENSVETKKTVKISNSVVFMGDLVHNTGRYVGGNFALDNIVMTSEAEESITNPVIKVTGVNNADRTVSILSSNTSSDNATKTYYTIDGTDPTTTSTEYTAPFVVSNSCTVKAITVKDGDANVKSDIVSLAVTAGEVKLNTPIIYRTGAHSYNIKVNATVTDGITATQTIHYTVNGGSENTGTTLSNVDGDIVAWATAPGFTDSDNANMTYVAPILATNETWSYNLNNYPSAKACTSIANAIDEEKTLEIGGTTYYNLKGVNYPNLYVENSGGWLLRNQAASAWKAQSGAAKIVVANVKPTDLVYVYARRDNTGDGVSAVSNGTISYKYGDGDRNSDFFITPDAEGNVVITINIGTAVTYVRVSSTSATKTLGETGFATFSATCPVTVPDGVTVYESTCDGETLTATPCVATVIPANTGVIVKGTKGTEYTFTATETAGSAITTALTAAPAGITSDGSICALLKDEMTFAKVMSGVTLGANTAYLPISAGAKNIRFVVGGATGIENVASAKATNKAVKRIMNGQLVIEKAGKMYNAAGQVTK